MRVRRLRDLLDRHSEMRKHLLDYRPCVERERRLQHRPPSLEPSDLLGHQLDVYQLGANFYVGGIGRPRQDIGFRAFNRLRRRRYRGQPISKRAKVISPNSEFESSQRITHRRRAETPSRLISTITFSPGLGTIRLRDPSLKARALPPPYPPTRRSTLAHIRSLARRPPGPHHLPPPD